MHYFIGVLCQTYLAFKKITVQSNIRLKLTVLKLTINAILLGVMSKHMNLRGLKNITLFHVHSNVAQKT